MPYDPELDQLNKDFKDKYSEVISLVESIFLHDQSLQRQGDIRRDLNYLKQKGIISDTIYNTMYALYPFGVNNSIYTTAQLQDYIQQLEIAKAAVQALLN